MGYSYMNYTFNLLGIYICTCLLTCSICEVGTFSWLTYKVEVDTSFELVQLIHPLHWQDIMLVNERWLLLIAEDMY